VYRAEGAGAGADEADELKAKSDEGGRRRARVVSRFFPFPFLFLFLFLQACTGPSAPGPWTEESGYRWRELAGIPRGTPGFTSLSPDQTGINFTNAVRDSLVLANRILVQGGGVALGDVDGDGLVDVYLCRTDGSNALYRNLGGWRFEDITAAAGVAAAERFSTGAVFADIDGDGDLDLLVLALGGPNAWFLNDGTGRFTERLLPDRAGSTTAALADADRDGDLDLVIANYKAYTTLDSLPPQVRAFDQLAREVAPRRFEIFPQFARDYKVVPREDLRGVSLVQRADPDFFYLNQGGQFERVPFTSDRFVDEQGKPLPSEPESFGLAAMFFDVDRDGDADLYIANDFEDPDEFWLNDGSGRFRLAPGTTLRTASNSTMAIDFADVNRDGLPDMLQVDMLSRDTRRLRTQIPTHTALPKMPGVIDDRPQMQRNTLFLNRGDGSWAQVAELAGVDASGWSWSALFSDVDLDGWEDILIGTGHPWDLMDADAQERLRNRLTDVDWRRHRWLYPSLKLPNVALRNRGDLTFEDATRAWRFGLEEDISHGMAIGDLDGDGDKDVIINRLDAPAQVMRNDATAARILVRLRGPARNTRAVGAVITVKNGAVPEQVREVVAGGLYLSHSDYAQSFATGSAEQVIIQVDWPDGRRTVVEGARPGREYEITAETAVPAPTVRDSAESDPPLFLDATAMLGHRHVEPAFDDWSRQLLLPNSLAQLGPGVAWVDLDRDGDEDLVIGSGKGGRLAWYRNDRGRLAPGPVRLEPATGDLTAMLGIPDGRGGTVLLFGRSNYEDRGAAEALAEPRVQAARLSAGALVVAGPVDGPDTATAGPLAAADYDRDGDLDLFIGGRVFPGAYPSSPSSRFLKNAGGARFEPDPDNSAVVRGIGMVSSAVFADIDGDGDSDLLLAREWGSIVLLLNEGGRFSRAPASWGLDRWSSRWNGIATGDLDGDGRLDIVATSWGRNTVAQADSARPLLLYFGQFDSNPTVDMLLARRDDRLGGPAPLVGFARLSAAVPDIAVRIRTFSNYADATVERVLGPAAASAATLGANTLDHMMFLNRGDHFEPRPLPLEAQFTPAFAPLVADFNGDGHEDVVLSQNFFPNEIQVPRYDAGRGLLLLGDGRGGLTPAPGRESGIIVWGDQRGAAYADYDADGRLDLVITQNGNATRLFRNSGATPGLRVRLEGPPENPDGIGAQIRLVFGERMGPVREIQAASGYWSANGPVQVLGKAVEPTGVWVRWPSGRTETVPIVGGAREQVVRHE
jgi:hypothetical protein